ncbi:hypothetical protein [Vampirovibrio chlorellavorus]|uniref:hypothetical protein n=1 Tax=Vampirovibrio chlorellavorus TaxID=758823 RepID=UPI0026F2C6B6|nr:hypothetical protein [Vampirovibrio chlorellavorus]
MRVFAPSFHLQPQTRALHGQDMQSPPIILNDTQDFDLPPILRLSPQQLEFIDLDQEASDTFVRHPHQQPETPRQQDNPFSAQTRRYKMPNTDLEPAEHKTKKIRKSSKERANSLPQLEAYRREIAPLLAQYQSYKISKNDRYPQSVKQLFHRAAQENPTTPTKHLADALGLPPAITYYWRGYRNTRPAKKTNKRPEA